MKTISLCVLLLCSMFTALSQDTTNRRSFYPYHPGDIRQYRSAYTGNIIYTEYTDSVKIDSLTKDTFVFGRSVAGSTNPTEIRIDSLGNLYNMEFKPQYIRYKLYADSGDSWMYGDTTGGAVVTVTRVYQASVYGNLATVKVFNFNAGSYSLGNDYLADGFGLIQADVEPSDRYYLSGAIIDTTHYGIIADVEKKEELVKGFYLNQNFPNPFNSSTIIQYNLSKAGMIQLKVYDMLGRAVATLIEEYQYPGRHTIRFEPAKLASGVYFYELVVEGKKISRSMLYVK